MTRTLILLSLLLSCANGQFFDALYKKLAKKGIKNTIPANSLNEGITVHLKLMLIDINSLDTETGNVDLDAWLSQSWQDGRLSWNPAEYDNISHINVLHSDLWKPDIIPYRGHMQVFPESAVVSNDGNVMFIPVTRLKFRCNVTKYTSDGTVTCNLKIGSWAYSGSRLNLTIDGDGLDVSEYDNYRWSLVRKSGKIHQSKYECCPQLYPNFMITMVFKDGKNKKGYFNIF